MSKTTSQDIKATLWKAAGTFRGTIDAANYKDFVLSMLFLKYLDDTYKEHLRELEERYKGNAVRIERAKKNLPFVLGDKERFDYLYEHRFDPKIGEMINTALQGIQDSNAELRGVFRSINFNSESMLGNPQQKVTKLRTLLEDFKPLCLEPSQIEVGPGEDPAYVIGDAYEYMVGEFAAEAGKKAGSFFTPSMVSELMGMLTAPKRNETIYDPTCGSGSLLIRTARQAGSFDEVALYGQEMNGSSWSMARMNLFIHGMPNHQIFNERPESQDRALKELQAMGYQYIPRAEAEQKRGHLSHVLFPDVLREFLASQSFMYRGMKTPFPDDAIGEAIRDLDAPLERGLMFSSKAIYDRLIYGKSCDVNLYDGNTQSFDISYIDWEYPENNIWQVTDEFSVERPNGKFARPDIVLLVNGIPLVVIECKKSSVDVEEGVKQNVRNWQPDYIPQLFKFTQLAIAMNPETVKYGTAGTKQEFYCKWHEEDVQWQEEAAKRYVDDSHITEQDRVIVSMLSRLLFTKVGNAKYLKLMEFTVTEDDAKNYLYAHSTRHRIFNWYDFKISIYM